MLEKVAIPAVLCIASCTAAAQSTGQLLERANEQYRHGNAGEAAQLYQQYLGTFPNRADVRIYLGAALLSLNRYPEAMAEAHRAIELDPSASRGYTLIGRIHAAQRQWEAAERQFEKAASLNPTDRENFYFSGRAFLDASQFDQAIRRFLQAIAFGAKESRVYQNLGLSYESVGQLEKAESAYRSAIQAPGAGADAPYRYGLFLYKQNRLSESVKLLEASLRLSPNSIDTRFALARALYRSSEFQSAEEILDPVKTAGDCRVHHLLLQIYSARNLDTARATELKSLETCAAP